MPEFIASDTHRVSHLCAAREMRDFRVEPERDIRAWPVFTDDERLVGAVDRLIVELSTGRVRYVAVTLMATAGNRPRPGSMLIPIGLVRRMHDHEAVVVRGLDWDQLDAAPRLPARPVTRADEAAALWSYGLAPAFDRLDDAGYSGALFDASAVLDADLAVHD